MKPRNTLFFAIIALFVIVLTTAQSAVASHVFATGRTGANTALLNLSISPFSVSEIGITPVERFGGIDFQPGTGVLFASTGSQGVNPRSLFTIDTTTGDATLVGPTNENIFEVAFGLDGTLYGNSTGDDGSLFTVDTLTGAATVVGPFGNPMIESLAVDPTSGILYGLGYRDGELFTIDTGTGVATQVGVFADLNASIPGVGLVGLGIDHSGGFFISIGSNDGRIFSVDPADFSAFTLVGDAGSGSTTDIAFLVPEPSSIALALFGLTFSCTCIRRKK